MGQGMNGFLLCKISFLYLLIILLCSLAWQKIENHEKKLSLLQVPPKRENGRGRQLGVEVDLGPLVLEKVGLLINVRLAWMPRSETGGGKKGRVKMKTT